MPTLTAAAGLSVTYRQQYRRCGSPRCHRCAPGAPGHGPYWYAFWAEGGRTRSRYLGKERPPEAGEGTSRPGLALVVPAVPSAPDEQPITPARRDDRQPRAVQHMAPAPRQTTASTREDRPGAAPERLDESEALPTVPPLRVQTLGGFAVWRGDEALAAGRWARGKVGALCKLLLSAPRHTVPAEQVIDQLWPEADPAQGAANLRSTIRYLRATLDGPAEGPSYLRSSGATLALDPAPGETPPLEWLDASAFERRARAALRGADRSACHAALSLYGGTYLPDDPYEDWAEGRRTQLAGLHERLLLHLAGLAERAAEMAEAIWAFRAVLAADPCQEEAARPLMALLLGQGRQAEALRVYRGLARALREELAVAPAPETEALRASIRLQALVPAPVAPNNLPAATTRFIGREAELAALEHALLRGQAGTVGGAGPGTRLLTLVGVGGTGKTRLALALAEVALPAYPDGVWLVELAALPPVRSPDPTPVVRAVAAALGVREQSGQTLLETLAGHLREKRLLLVLDNCEHLVAAAAALAARLLAGCRGLQVLVTSREALGMAGETLWPVPPLALPPEAKDGAAVLEQVAQAEAVALFVARAQAVRPGFALTAQNAGLVAAICRGLDGLPLAIELAVARLQALGLEEVAARLDDRFRLLRQGNRAALPRHQTLRAALDWSWDLLSAQEQVLLRRLAVFAGGWTLAGAEAVAEERLSALDSTPARGNGQLLDYLAGLIAKSLVVLREDEDGTRYGLLELVRQYAMARLVEAGESVDVRDRHLAWYLTLAEEAVPRLEGPEQRAWLARLDREHDNLRAALRWACEGDRGELGLRLAGALWRFWFIRSHLSEGRRWLDAVLGETSQAPAAVRALALIGAGTLAFRQANYGRAVALLEECRALQLELGNREGLAWAQFWLGAVAFEMGEDARAVALFEESLVHWRALEYVPRIAHALNGLGAAAVSQGEYARAADLYEQALVLVREHGHWWHVAYILFNLGALAYRQGDHARAAALQRECLVLGRDHQVRQVVAGCLNLRARLLAACGQFYHSARLCGAAEAAWAAVGEPLPRNERTMDEQTLKIVRAALGEDAFAAAWANGQNLALEEAIALALEEEPALDQQG